MRFPIPTRISKHAIRVAIASLAFLLADRTRSQIFSTLHSFTGDNNGGSPTSGVALFDDSLYGTTIDGGKSTAGTVYKVSTDGTRFVILYNFTAPSSDANTNADGAAPNAVIASGDTLYGTAQLGGN